MKLVIEKLPDLRALYIRQLRLLLSAEEQILRGLPIMIEIAVDTQLKGAFQSHLQETEIHFSRLKNILESLAGEAEHIKCNVLGSLMQEAEDQVRSCTHDAVRDAALIVEAQRIEHYEIAAYGAVVHFAMVLGRDNDLEMLDQTLHEEAHADQLLTHIAERVNPAARRMKIA